MANIFSLRSEFLGYYIALGTPFIHILRFSGAGIFYPSTHNAKGKIYICLFQTIHEHTNAHTIIQNATHTNTTTHLYHLTNSHAYNIHNANNHTNNHCPPNSPFRNAPLPPPLPPLRPPRHSNLRDRIRVIMVVAFLYWNERGEGEEEGGEGEEGKWD
ncbi:hypothetical protein BKA61DRAFT_179006 [Leptodontidium sp. MPI-SDFR-AT-0119]|nr:hypothetical protein BKA61DRAFT_179006 [Leptodontidium sp. MPI-SDFR-AT-0119]